MKGGARGWYESVHPAPWIDSVDPRCWLVLAEMGKIHNLVREDMTGGGIGPCGDGLEVVYCHELASFDGDELTRLVVAAHEHYCRVAVNSVDLGRVGDGDQFWVETMDDWRRRGYWIGDEVNLGMATCGECGEVWWVDGKWAHECSSTPELPTLELAGSALRVRITPRDPFGKSSWESHPGVERLR